MKNSFAVSWPAPQDAAYKWHHMKRIFALGVLTLLAACTAIPKGGKTPKVDVAAEYVAKYGNTHRVALLLPLSGEDSDVGRALSNATVMAVADTKRTDIIVSRYDTAAMGMTAATEQAVADGNRLILGPLRGEHVTQVAAIARPAGIPIISYSNDASVAGKNVFILGHLPNQSIDRIIKYARVKGMTNFAAIVPKSTYGQRADKYMTQAVANAGGKLIGIREVDGTKASSDSAARALAGLGRVDAILVAAPGNEAVAIFPSIKANGLAGAKILGTDLWNISSAVANSKHASGSMFASVSDGIYTQYADRYKRQFGKSPLRLSSLGYDSIALVARVAKTWQYGQLFPLNQLVDTGGFSGIDGSFRMLPNGLNERMLEVQEIRSGKYVTIENAPKSFVQ